MFRKYISQNYFYLKLSYVIIYIFHALTNAKECISGTS
jgi:hypothetical protein